MEAAYSNYRAVGRPLAPKLLEWEAGGRTSYLEQLYFARGKDQGMGKMEYAAP